jgi:hypothetical protein
LPKDLQCERGGGAGERRQRARRRDAQRPASCKGRNCAALRRRAQAAGNARGVPRKERTAAAQPRRRAARSRARLQRPAGQASLEG